MDRLSEEEHLRSIWRELGVGKNGYLSLPELATVCENIGMDEMSEEVSGCILILFLLQSLDINYIHIPINYISLKKLKIWRNAINESE